MKLNVTRKSTRGLVLGMLALMVALLLVPTTALAKSQKEYYTVSVAKGYLALRTAPAYDERNEIGELYTGDTVRVKVENKTSGTYWWVYSPKYGRSGYVNRNYLVYAGATTGKTYTVTVSKGYLALRTAPAYDERNEIGALYTGDTVKFIESYNGTYWWVYSPKYGTCGYVNKNYLTSSYVDNYGSYTVRVNKGYLALRTAPAYDERNEIGELYTGDTVVVKDKSNGTYWWVYSPKYNRNGYVNKNYLVK